MMRLLSAILLGLAASLAAAIGCSPTSSFGGQREDRAGWVYVRLEGSPHDIGFQHGSAIAPEIDSMNKMIRVYLKESTGKDWAFYREASLKLFLPKLDRETRDELQGLSDGLKSKGYSYDLGDMIAHNAWIELAWYYVPVVQAREKKTAVVSRAPAYCSAFVATGSQTADGQVVMGHNAWIDYVIGEHWNVILDIHPRHGNRILMDAMPGFIHSGDDFAVNSAGILVTETTIAAARGFDENGLPEFMRARKAVQYSNSLDDFARIMTSGNNGGYANTWLAADTKTGEIGKLEMGLKNVIFRRSTDGAYYGSNYPEDPKLIAEDCDGDPTKGSNCCTDRKVRWAKLMEQTKGKVDAELGKTLLADHHDEVRGIDGACGSTICGHLEVETRPGFLQPAWPYAGAAPAGAAQAKVVTTALARNMSFWARMGHPCGEPFYAAPFLKTHPEFGWQKPFLGDLPGQPWTLFAAR
ncbi:MAG: peptidase C45 [Fimbriimonas ginsengisoli]|uniref:Peptidase C45 n=1 Tax=Fimbriimonas ginsengisoli TaxID=1005039 RepID=A0A931LQZ6_FIMGI|nr:peptidase C45 [Fimbriimonas ginsengisoli]